MSLDIPGVPTHAFTLSNSERSTSACELRWFMRYGLGLRPKSTSRPLSFGDAAHKCLEELFTYWKDNGNATIPTKIRNGTTGPTLTQFDRFEREWANTDKADDVEILWDMIRGYVFRWGMNGVPGYDVIGVEVVLGTPIRDRSGNVFAPEMPMIVDGDRCWVPRPGEVPTHTARWPWYYHSIVDVILRSRVDGSLWNLEHKTASGTARKLRSLQIDPQSVGYCWAMDGAVRTGLLLGAGPNDRVAGWMHDVIDSGKHTRPKVLKDGSVSTAKAKTASWIFAEAIVKAGVDPAPYSGHLYQLRAEVDSALYVRDFKPIDTNEMLRFGEEIYAVARRMARLKSSLAGSATLEDVHDNYPRTAVCAADGGYCDFMGACLTEDFGHGALIGKGPITWPVEGAGLSQIVR